MKDTVTSATTAWSAAAPVSASTPLGTSTDSTGRLARFIRATASPNGGRNGPLKPVPNRASTMTVPLISSPLSDAVTPRSVAQDCAQRRVSLEGTAANLQHLRI